MKIRMNELARELELKVKTIIEVMTKLGITRVVTHNSSLEEAEADAVRRHFAANPNLREPKVDQVTLGRAKSIAAQFGEEL